MQYRDLFDWNQNAGKNGICMIVRTVAELAEIVVERGKGRNRSIIAIAGPPGVGKSTLSSRLMHQLVAGGYNATIVQMDGFHLDNDTLRARGLFERKGAPETFDATGLVKLVGELHAHSADVGVPEFERDIDSVRRDATIVDLDCRFVLVEGNYLLLDSAPWTGLQPFFDCRIFLTADMDELRKRLVSRWLMHGFERQEAEAKAFGNDIPNAERVLVQSLPADIVFDPTQRTDPPG